MSSSQYLDLVDLALGEAAKTFPSFVKGLHRKLGVNSRDDDAVFVWVILADDTPPAERRHEKLQPIADAIRGAIWDKLGEQGLELYPQVNFRLKSEHDRVVGAA
jgi:hypothetical protein